MSNTMLKFIAAVVLLTLSGCARNEIFVGYSFPENYQERLKIGRTNKDDVLEFMGTPTSESTFGDKKYFYVAQKQVSKTFLQPVVETQEVLEISFDQKGLLNMAKIYDIKNHQMIMLDEKRTILKGNEMGVFEQMMHNIGRYGGKTAK